MRGGVREEDEETAVVRVSMAFTPADKNISQRPAPSF